MLNTLLSSFYFWFFFLFVILFPFFLPLCIRISFHNLRNDISVSLELEIKLLKKIKLFIFEKNFSPAVDEEGVTNFLRYQFPRLREIVYRRKLYWVSLQKLYLIFYRFASSFLWLRLDIFCKLGTGDPASTGILTGSMRFLSDVISSHIYRIFTFPVNRPRILIYPSFLKREFIIFISCELKSSGVKLFMHLFLIIGAFITESISKKFLEVGQKWRNILFKA